MDDFSSLLYKIFRSPSCLKSVINVFVLFTEVQRYVSQSR